MYRRINRESGEEEKDWKKWRVGGTEGVERRRREERNGEEEEVNMARGCK